MSARSSTVALIPARGGSRRLPRKNVRVFAGRPLIYYSIALARAVETIDRCIVSTEDPEIAQVARTCGAEVIERPVELADDHTTTASVAVHAVRTLAISGHVPDVIVLLQPTCPLRPRALVVQALELFANGSFDSVISVTPDHGKTGEISGGLFVPSYRPGTRSQDMPARYREDGLVYVTAGRRLCERGEIFGSHVRPLVTEPLYAMGDIDSALDFAVAEFLFETHRSHFDWVPPVATPALA